MRIAEGMSYKHSEVIIKARGKQIQRAVEVAVMLQQRGRGRIVSTAYSVEGELHIPSIIINMTV
jgi:DNA-binding protein